MAKLADAADLKSAGPQGLWGFKSPSGHHRGRGGFLLTGFFDLASASLTSPSILQRSPEDKPHATKKRLSV